MDSHGDNVSSDSALEMTDCLGFACGAYELVALLLFDVGFRFIDDFAEIDVSFSVGVSTIECNCVLDAKKKEEKNAKRNNKSIKISKEFCLCK